MAQIIINRTYDPSILPAMSKFEFKKKTMPSDLRPSRGVAVNNRVKVSIIQLRSVFAGI